MWYYIAILILLPFLSYGQKIPRENDPKLRNCCTNVTKTDSLNGKAISYYLNHKNIDRYSKLFYNGEFAIYDNDEFFSLMDSLLTHNNDTRPFYLFNFNRILDKSDGCISEIASEYCLRYIEKYPCDFLKAYYDKHYQTYRQQWADFIGFSLGDGDYSAYRTFISRTEKSLYNCSYKKTWEKFKAALTIAVSEHY